MPRYVVAETIGATPDEIWPVLADVLRWPEWTPTVSSVEPVDAPTLEVGSRFEVVQPRLRPTIWTVTAVDPPRSFTWEARSTGMCLVAEHVLVKEGARRTRLELTFTFAGVLGSIVGHLARKLTVGYMTTEASGLRDRVQGFAAGRGGCGPT